MPSDLATRFVTNIAGLAESPGPCADLRSGLRRTPQQAHRMHRYLASWVPEQTHPDREAAWYAVAALIAHEPHDVLVDDPPRNLGASLTRLDTAPDTQVRYLHLLTRQSAGNVARYVMEVVGTLRGQKRPGVVDFAQLLDDLWGWPWRQQEITKRWLQAYYRASETE